MPRKRLIRDDYRFTPKDRNTPVVLAARRPPPMHFKAEGNNCNFSSWYGHGIDNIAHHLHSVMWERKRTGARTDKTLLNYFHVLDKIFVPFLQELAAAEGRALKLKDITKERIHIFIDWLRHRPAGTETGVLSYGGQRAYYKATKSVLGALCMRRLLPPARSLFPRNPYPGANRRSKGAKPYSSAERDRLLQALVTDLRDWKAGKRKLKAAQVLMLYFLIIAARTGRNTTPLFELTRDALRPHPIKPDRWLLVTYKRRGYSTHIQSFGADERRELSTITSLRASVVTLYEEALAFTQPLVARAPEHLRDRLWLYETGNRGNIGPVSVMSETSLSYSIELFVDHHRLLDDGGRPLVVTISKLRKTFINTIFEDTGGNLVATAMLAGHTPSVSDTQYLEAPPEAERNFKWVGEALVDHLRGHKTDGDRAVGVCTPVSRCKDSLFGKYAPKDGDTHCMDFLNCFRCPSQLVTGDDLWRMFSFYWLLVRERGYLPRNRWHKRYSWVIRVIDRSIAPKFHPDDVKAARERAHTDPHPMWLTRDALLAFGGESE